MPVIFLIEHERRYHLGLHGFRGHPSQILNPSDSQRVVGQFGVRRRIAEKLLVIS
jgi:hypothetical protein